MFPKRMTERFWSMEWSEASNVSRLRTMAAAQVHERMHTHGRLGLAEHRPRKGGQARIDGGGGTPHRRGLFPPPQAIHPRTLHRSQRARPRLMDLGPDRSHGARMDQPVDTGRQWCPYRNGRGSSCTRHVGAVAASRGCTPPRAVHPFVPSSEPSIPIHAWAE